MISMKAEEEWLKLTEAHLGEYSWPLFLKEYLIYYHKSYVSLGGGLSIKVYFQVMVEGNLSSYFSDTFNLYLINESDSSVELSVPFWWKWKLKRRVMKLMRQSLKEELKQIKGKEGL